MKIGRQSNHYFLSRLTDLIWITLNPQPATRKVLIMLCKIFQSCKLHLPDNDRYICTLERKANGISKRSQSCAEYIDCVENILLIVIWVGRIITALFVFCLTRYIGIYTRVKRCAKYQMMESK